MNKRGVWRIGGYVADELIGHGASAQVWRGHVARTCEPVALKVIDLADASAVRSARAEAAVLSALDHPHLVRLRELVPDGESIVLVLELAGGGSLAELVQRRGRLSPGEVVAALAPVAAALAYIHDQGVVHADVSPANILFRSDGTPILADLGVARLVGGFGAPRSTLAFVDPGVAAGGVPSDASDVFMTAATALHVLTGAPPWRGESAEEMLAQAALGEIHDLEARLSGLPAPMAEVIRRGLSASPAARLSAAEFALDLRHCVPPIPVDLGAGRARAPVARAPVARAPVARAPVARAPVARDPADSLDVARPDAPSLRATIRARLTGATGRAADPYVPSAAPAGAVHVPRHAARAEPARPVHARPDPSRSDPSRSDSPVSPVSMVSPVPPVAVVALDRPAFTRPDPRDVDAPINGESTPRTYGARPAPAVSRIDARSSDRDRGGGEPAEASQRLALTHIVRARVRATVPEPAPRRWPPGPPAVRIVVALALAVLLGSAGLAWVRWGPAWASGGRRSATAHSVPRSVSSPSASSSVSSSAGVTATTSTTTAASTTVPRAPVSAGSTASAPAPSAQTSSAPTPRPTATPNSSAGPKGPDAAEEHWAAVLESLDRHRQQAFATRDPAPLASVYVPGTLLTQDAQTLHRVVAPGYRLVGLRTEYRAVHASALVGGRVVLSARASLAPAELECPGSPPRQLAGDGPVPMKLVLVRRGPTYLISGINLLT